MIKEEKIKILKETFDILKTLTKEINEKVENAKEGVMDNNANLIMGGLADIDKTAQHLKNIYEAMLFIHRN